MTLDPSFIDPTTLAALNDTVDAGQEIRRRAADDLAAQHDKIITAAITKVLGPEVLLESLRGRLTMLTFSGSDNRVLHLDGRPLIEFYPLRSNTEHRNGSHFLNLQLPYRLFDWELEP